jgi:hypothetical protein
MIDGVGPPAPLRQSAPYSLELNEGGGWAMLFGLPFFVAGVFLLGAAVGYVPVNAHGQMWPRVLMALMCPFFVVPGGLLLFGRVWLTLDRSRGMLTRRMGLLVPMKTEERPLSDFKDVLMVVESGSKADTYPVKLRARDGKDFTISSSRQFGDAWTMAEYLARFLGLPLADQTTDHETVVRVGESLRERLGARLPTVAAPSTMQSEVRDSGRQLTIVIPDAKLPQVRSIFRFLPAAMALIVVPMVLRFLGDTPWPMQAFVVIFVLMFFGIPSMVMSAVGRRKRLGTTIMASSTGLVIERPGERQAIAATDVLDVDYSTLESMAQSVKASQADVAPARSEEVVVRFLRKWVPSRGIIVKTRQGMVTFGEGLPDAELAYLQSVLRKALGS